MKIVLDNPNPSMISYSTFDAGVRSWNERNTFQVLLARAVAERPAIQSFLPERASSLAPSNRLCQQQALSSDSDNLDKPLFFECCGDCAAQTKYTSGRIPKSSDGWPRNPARSTQRITDGVAARSPGKASSYLYAMKGEARRRRLKCLAPYGIRADPHRESYRFHHRNKYLSQYRSCLREEMNITSTLNQATGNNLGWKLSGEISSSVSGVEAVINFGDTISVIVKTLDPAL